MKKINKIGYVAIGMILTIVISCITPSVFATSTDAIKQLTAHFTSGGKTISMYINDAKITPVDANGKEVFPFIVDGTTYLPVRAIANALEKDVAWDADTASIKITDKASLNSNNAIVSTTKDKDGVITETIAYTFTFDKDAVGEWKSVGYCDLIDDFDPDKLEEDDQWYNSNSIYSDGTMVARFIDDNGKPKNQTGLHWTKGYLVDLMSSAMDLDVVPAYWIKTIDGRKYMFLEWKSGDYVYRGERVAYYVFEKISDTPVPVIGN